jgi:aspartate carbamoyltransferase catalytic subunit
MNHFLEISELSRQQIDSLLKTALMFKQQNSYPAYPSHPVAFLFYENSTRTRVSFEMAAKHLSMPTIHLDMASSSESKGETIEDTLENLAAMGIKQAVVRHQQNGIQQRLAQQLGPKIHIINAGDGTQGHPSQALLDLMTILEKKPNVSQLKVAILGNIRHSRVANSFQHIAKTMGIGELVLIAPEVWQPEIIHYGQSTTQLSEGLANADVIMCLRVQRERLEDSDQMDLNFYRNHYALTAKHLSYAKPDAMVMHPGPMNRGIEIDDEIADGPQSVILKQVSNGVYARMAIFDALVRG